jgi:hypothetical protein
VLTNDLARILEKIADRYDDSLALKLLYAYVLRRPIDPDGLLTRLTRIMGRPGEYVQIVSEILASEEATRLHGHSAYSTLDPLTSLSSWLDERLKTAPMSHDLLQR